MSSSRSQKSPERPGLLEILFASAWAFLLFRSFSKFSTPIRKSADAPNSDDSTNDRAENPGNYPSGGIGIAKTNCPPAPSQCNYSKKKPKHWLKRWKPYVFLLNVGTFIAVVWYACITKNMWQEMQSQTGIQRDAYVAAQRPWIKIIEVDTRGNSPIVPALSFQEGMGAGKPFQQATFQLKVSVKNVGHSVAEVSVRPDLFLAPWSEGSFFEAVTKEQKSFCDSDYGAARSGYYPSTIVFPEEPFDWYGAGSKISDSQIVSKFPETGNREFVVPVVIVCVDYRLKSLPSAYQTSAVYEVFRKDNRTRFFERGIGVPADKIFLVRDPQLDYAN